METNKQDKTFASFAAARFQKNHTVGYDHKPLTEALLDLSSSLDQDAARTVSLAIHRYTEDAPEPSGPYPTKSIYRELITGLKRGSSDGNFNPSSLIHGRKTTDLDKVHLICGLGVLGPQLRDEIFCQICKHIVGNPTRKSRQKGWTLLGCCLCTFLPSDEFAPYLDNFLKSAPEQERRYFEEKFRRTRLNGNKNEPPSSIEHQAIAQRVSFSHAVIMMNGQVCKVPLDSASTGLELRKRIKAINGMVDLFGFAFRVYVGNKVSKVIGGGDHVMDIICSCEQIAKEYKLQDPCKIEFFKEIFSPWYSPLVDAKATELIYNQIIQSTKTRKLKIKEDLTLAKIIAKHCYVLYGATASRKNMEEVLTFLVPAQLMANTKSKTKENWFQMVETSFDKKYRRAEGMNQKNAVAELVNYAKHHMIEDFSRHFELVSGGSSGSGNKALLSVNWKNVRFYPSKPTLPFWNLTFPEIRKVSYEKLKGRKTGTVTITSLHNQERKLVASKAEDIHELINFFLTGLRRRSRYLLALRDFQPTGVSFALIRLKALIGNQ